MIFSMLQKIETFPFSLKKQSNYIAASHPLSLPENFEQALKLVSERFAPADHRFGLITKSHGNSFLLMVPRITIRHEMISKEALLELINTAENPRGIPPWMKDVGTTRLDYFNSIKKIGSKHGIGFTFVFTESCKSRIGISDLKELPANIETLISPIENVDYSSVDYQEVLSSGQQPLVAIETRLASLFPGDVAHKSWNWKLLLWWIPFLLLLPILYFRRSFRS